MTDELEVAFVIDSPAPPSLETLASFGEDTDEYETTTTPFEAINLRDKSDRHSLLTTLEVHDTDDDWFTLPSLPAVTLELSYAGIPDDELVAHVERFLDHVTFVYANMEDCRFAYALDGEHKSNIDSDAGPGVPITADSLAANRIETVSWLMLFSPPMVAEYGREWLLNAPAWKTRELDDGAVMLVASPDPTDWEEFRAARAELDEYFSRST
ncbi:hypothetical protein [Haloarcula salinisoli]|nr:hypothetical protein [Halomicroarcula salinisoli]